MKQDHYNHAHLSTYLKHFRFMLNMVITSKMQNISQSSVVIHCPCFILVSAKLYGKSLRCDQLTFVSYKILSVSLRSVHDNNSYSKH